jgi:hypothetical protein
MYDAKKQDGGRHSPLVLRNYIKSPHELRVAKEEQQRCMKAWSPSRLKYDASPDHHRNNQRDACGLS